MGDHSEDTPSPALTRSEADSGAHCPADHSATAPSWGEANITPADGIGPAHRLPSTIPAVPESTTVDLPAHQQDTSPYQGEQNYFDYFYLAHNPWSSGDPSELPTQLALQEPFVPTSFNGESGPFEQSPLAGLVLTPFSKPAADPLYQSPSWDYDCGEGETPASYFLETNTPGLFRYTSPFALPSPPFYGTPVPIQGTSDIDPVQDAFDPLLYSGMDTAGPSGITPVPLADDVARAGPSKPLKRSHDAVTPPAKRVRRVSQESPGDIEAPTTAINEGDGFVKTGLSLKVQEEMRALVGRIRRSSFFTANTPEPNFGTKDANTLMEGVSPEIWQGHRGSLYSPFIKAEENDFKCLWCGDIQQGKLKRAIGHFRAKHLGHRPFACGMIHIAGKVCAARFATLEAMGHHRKKKKELQEKGKISCPRCGRFYTSVSNRNRHLKICRPNNGD